jgi:uncharacterized 2Fe-2S/4Fe-4S cluster protein (DUF4445 family)
MSEFRVLFLPNEQKSLFEQGITLRDAALELGIVIESTCGGKGTCGTCRAVVKKGVSPITASERMILSAEEIAGGIRLSCQARIEGESVVVIPTESRVFGDQIMTEGVKGKFQLDPDIRKIFLQMPEHRIGDKYFDYETIVKVLESQSVPVRQTSLDVIRKVPQIVRQAEGRVTAVIDQEQLLAIEPGNTVNLLYGVAVDIGTTTVVAKLIDINSGHTVEVASALNSQKVYGDDVVSRVNYCIEHENGLESLHESIIGLINDLIGEACSKAEVSVRDIYKLTVVGNTVMNHLVLKIDPRNIAFMPYTPAVQGPITVLADELGIKINEHGVVYFLPNLGCFVGSDITGVLTALNFEESDEIQLAVDIGTNGEMVLGSRKRLLASSSPAGPAWEGAYITWGMRAARGAIERIEVDTTGVQFKVIGNVEPIGICGSGLLDIVAGLVRLGIINNMGRIVNREDDRARVSPELEKRIIASTNNSVYDFEIGATVTGKTMLLTQKDVREVQLAKGAIAAGVNILMKELRVTPEQISHIYIAGAFGNHVRGEDALTIGLLPDVPKEKIKFIGNAACSGAEMVLVSKEARQKAERLAEVVDYVETANDPEFQSVFAESMLFPG